MTVNCATHGESKEAFVCEHLIGETVGLGFNSEEPTVENPFPEAWCDNCEIIRAAHNGWDEQSEQLLKIVLLCSRCYGRARIRNTKPTVTFDDLATLKWKCGTCEDWHTGPCLDFSYRTPVYWGESEDAASRRFELLPRILRRTPKTFLNEDQCVINGEHYFVRGIIHLPIVGAAETFRWGVWGSLSRESFEELEEKWDDPTRVELPPLFSWLSNEIPEYPDTLNLRMHARIQEPGVRPNFYLEHSDHPLAREFHEGITPERVKQIMLARLRRE